MDDPGAAASGCPIGGPGWKAWQIAARPGAPCPDLPAQQVHQAKAFNANGGIFGL